MIYISLLAQTLAVLLLLGVAWYDVRHYTIRNKAVLVLLALYLPAQGALGFPTIWSDLAAGALLFVLGFVLWMLRGLGAGDAKLMFPLGLHLGYVSLLPFSILLMVSSILLYAGILICHMAGWKTGFGGWLAGLKTRGRVPYGLVLAASSVPVLVARIVWLA